MNESIEIHDSVLADIIVQGAETILHFKDVYIHKTMGRPLIDAGTGWIQEAQLRFRDATVEGKFSEFPLDLDDGHLQLGEEILNNTIPIPLNFDGEVELHIQGWGETVTLRGLHVRLELLGTAQYLEEFPGS